MSNSIGRGGRRRRVLNEEMVAASGTHTVPRGSASDSVTIGAPVYGEDATSTNHARISDLLPRKSRTIWLGWLASLSVVAGLAVAGYFQAPIANFVGQEQIRAINLWAPGNLASWMSASVFLAASVICLLIYSVRRHRLDDYRGRYRIWVWASAACLALSMNAVTQLHLPLSEAAAHLTGLSALANHGVWWLTGGAIVFGWIGFRSLFDLWESRLARMAATIATLALAVSIVDYFRWLPIPTTVSADLADLVTPVAGLIACVSCLFAIVAYARFVILAADGLLTARKAQASSPRAKTSKPTAATKNSRSAASIAKQSAAQPAAKVEWTDGSTPDDGYEDADGPPKKRKLSKSERKRLRRLKAEQRRAA